MAFRIAARTILELGAELISSDGIALYELIKNGIDAGSRRVRIDVQIVVTRSRYNALLEEVETNPGSAAVAADAVVAACQDLTDAIRNDLKTRLAAAPDLSELKRLLKVWYDELNLITVSDLGHGMSLEDLRTVYLTVGTRSRLKERERINANTQRAPLGEKGVGRLSTMRLGETLLVKTSRSGEKKINRLAIDWTLFDHTSDALLEDIVLEPVEAETKQDPTLSGTNVVIAGLKSDWTAAKLHQIAGAEFARLVDPWAERTAINLIVFTFNGSRVDIPQIDRDFLARAHGFCRASYDIQNGEPTLSGIVEYKLRKKEKAFSLSSTELVSVMEAPSVSALRSLGPFTMEMWWFNRGLLTVKKGVPDSSELKAEIARWSGGLMLFRDGYRVNPYGGADDDWLELDKDAFRAAGYKLNRQQIVGCVRISWRNRGLLDQTNREGLVATPERNMLIRALRYVLLTEFKRFIEHEDKAVRITERTTLETVGERVETAENNIREKLREIEQQLPERYRVMAKQANTIVDDIVRYVDEAKDLGEQYVEDRAQLVYLAGVGLMVEFVLHELDRATEGTLRTLKTLDTNRLPAASVAALRTLSDQIETLNKRVANLEALGTVRRQTKSDFSISELASRTLSARLGEAHRHNIEFETNFADPSVDWKVRGVVGMFIQIVDNLLANALYWMKRQKLVEHNFVGRLTISADRTERTLTITDNGPGVDPSMADEIFQPFVTRKPAGEGRGLGLYICREVASNQGWTIELLKEETVRPGRYNTFVIGLPSGKTK